MSPGWVHFAARRGRWGNSLSFQIADGSRLWFKIRMAQNCSPSPECGLSSSACLSIVRWNFFPLSKQRHVLPLTLKGKSWKVEIVRWTGPLLSFWAILRGHPKPFFRGLAWPPWEIIVHRRSIRKPSHQSCTVRCATVDWKGNTCKCAGSWRSFWVWFLWAPSRSRLAQGSLLGHKVPHWAKLSASLLQRLKTAQHFFLTF